jgi:hypothetical protein
MLHKAAAGNLYSKLEYTLVVVTKFVDIVYSFKLRTPA